MKVVDFGIAVATVSSHHTNPGTVRGKASYMSPEQALGDMVDLRTDVFALGIVLYELTTGRRCFHGTNDFERMLAVVRNDYVPPTVVVPDFPPALAQIIRTALAYDPANRYCSAAALAAALDRAAHAMGWIAGSTTISDFMHELYGENVRDPGESTTSTSSSEIIEEIASHSDSQEAIVTAPTVPISMPRPTRRLACGTGCEIVAEVDDDQPTRGRRSVPKILVPRCSTETGHPGPRHEQVNLAGVHADGEPVAVSIARGDVM